MRLSQYLITTSKEAPTEAKCISHKLMLRAGLIMRFAAGVYSYLPLGYTRGDDYSASEAPDKLL